MTLKNCFCILQKFFLKLAEKPRSDLATWVVVYMSTAVSC